MESVKICLFFSFSPHMPVSSYVSPITLFSLYRRRPRISPTCHRSLSRVAARSPLAPSSPTLPAVHTTFPLLIHHSCSLSSSTSLAPRCFPSPPRRQGELELWVCVVWPRWSLPVRLGCKPRHQHRVWAGSSPRHAACRQGGQLPWWLALITTVGGWLPQRWQLNLPPKNFMYWGRDFLLNFVELGEGFWGAENFFFSIRTRIKIRWSKLNPSKDSFC